MTYKTFFFNCSKTDIQIKNLLTTNIFPKFLLRKRFKSNKLLNSLENVFNIDTNSFYSFKTLFQTKVGKSIFLKKILYSHNKLKKLKLKSFFFTENYLKKIKLTSLFLSSVNLLNILKIPKLTLIVCPTKGGYTVFSQGLVGYLPNSHYRIYFFKQIKNFKFKSNFILKVNVLNPIKFNYFRYFFSIFSVCKMLCIVKKVAINHPIRKQKFIYKQKLKNLFKYKIIQTNLYFKFIFFSPHIKFLPRVKKFFKN